MTVRAPQRERGFTLIELLVTGIVLGVLAAIAIPVYLDQRKRAVDASVKADIKAAVTVAETLTVDNPTASAFAATSADIRATFRAAGFKTSRGNEVYIAGSPIDGYCIVGKNVTSGSGATPSTYFWYDSRNGGLRAGRPSSGYNTVGLGVTCDNTFIDAHGGYTWL